MAACKALGKETAEVPSSIQTVHEQRTGNRTAIFIVPVHGFLNPVLRTTDFFWYQYLISDSHDADIYDVYDANSKSYQWFQRTGGARRRYRFAFPGVYA